MKLSLVVPCYNEEGNVERFFSETNRVFANNVDDYEFVFVDDGSTDSTYSKLESIYVSNPQSDIQVLSFSRMHTIMNASPGVSSITFAMGYRPTI